jgi:alpha-mannosidase
MENKLIRIKFANDGPLLSVFDKENQREVFMPGQRGNSLVVYDDSGDAWDFSAEYRKGKTEQFTLLESNITRNGPELINHQVYEYEESILKQNVVLTANDRRIDFRTEVSWATPAKMVRTSFPVDVPNGNAMCEIQFGAIERPVHSDTSWDSAKDEISAHGWIDISNNRYGAALLNDSKYGHRVKDRILDLSLLRSVPYPGPLKGFTDIGEHNFTYSLFPHKGNYSDGGVVQAAHELISPPVIYQLKKNTHNYGRSFFSTGDSSFIISTIKKAENSEAIIIRLYESEGKRISTWLEAEMFKPQSPSAISPVKATLVNLLEEYEKPLQIKNCRIELTALPYEIISIKLDY